MTTFSQQSEIYLARIALRKRKPVKPTSIATIRSLLNAADPVLGNMELECVKNGALRTLADTLSRNNYSGNSIQSILTAAKMVIASSVDEEGEPRFPRTWKNDFILENVPAGTAQKNALVSAHEIEAAILQTCSPLREFIATQAATGCRKGELLALRVADFDSGEGLLRISRTLSRHGETATKTRSGSREVDMIPEITAMLLTMLAGRTTGRLFNVTIDEVRWAFEKAKIKSHSLRHFRYTHLQKYKVHPAIQNYWIGHSTKGMAEIYGHLEADIELRQRLVREVGLGFILPSVAVPATEAARDTEMATA